MHLTTCMTVVLEVQHLGTLGLQFLGRIEGNIGLACIQQLFHIFLINVATLALAIGAFVASEGNTLVKLDAEPLERLDDIFFGTRHKTSGVGILNTEHQIATVLARKQIVI